MMKTRFTRVALVLAVLLAAATISGCEPSPGTSRTDAPTREGSSMATMTITIESPAFAEGQAIPTRHTGDGEDLSPALTWQGLPAGTRELALVCDDPDAPTAAPWVHWVIYGIAPDATGLTEAIATDERLEVPAGARQGVNSWKGTGYRGPAPPRGHGTHHYRFRLYALDAPLELPAGLGKDELLAAMAGHVLAEGELVGTYRR